MRFGLCISSTLCLCVAWIAPRFLVFPASKPLTAADVQRNLAEVVGSPGSAAYALANGRVPRQFGTNLMR